MTSDYKVKAPLIKLVHMVHHPKPYCHILFEAHFSNLIGFLGNSLSFNSKNQFKPFPLQVLVEQSLLEVMDLQFDEQMVSQILLLA